MQHRCDITNRAPPAGTRNRCYISFAMVLLCSKPSMESSRGSNTVSERRNVPLNNLIWTTIDNALKLYGIPSRNQRQPSGTLGPVSWSPRTSLYFCTYLIASKKVLTFYMYKYIYIYINVLFYFMAYTGIVQVSQLMDTEVFTTFVLSCIWVSFIVLRMCIARFFH